MVETDGKTNKTGQIRETVAVHKASILTGCLGIT